MLGQVKEHLGAIRAIRGGRPSTRAAQAPARDERARDASQREMGLDERTRELYASVESQQRRLSQALEQSGDLLSASKDQADRFDAMIEEFGITTEPLLRLARKRIEELNQKYGGAKGGAFFLFHRPRSWNPREQLWMGYERKRGKLADLNAMLRGDTAPVVGLVVQLVLPLTSDAWAPDTGATAAMSGALRNVRPV